MDERGAFVQIQNAFKEAEEQEGEEEELQQAWDTQQHNKK